MDFETVMADIISCKQMPAKSAMFRCVELILPAALLHVALAGCPAETGACHGHGFSPSSGARKGRI
jgi:hypothetical protein